MLSQPAQPQTPDLSRRLAKLTSILDVAKAMSAERDLDLLLPLILFEATKVVEADRCSLFILDRERNELWSKVAQGSKNEIRLPLGSGISGQVAQTGAVINIPDAYSDPRFNRSFDVSSGYQTKTILCVPMRDANGEVTGVIQALNKLDGGSFNAEDEELLLALGAQAAGAIENALLHEEINRLFEGFVSASVVAIEARDPTTAGHSGRVADLTVSLAQALEHLSTGPHAHVRFSPVELQELRYASLLHDFGKVGVREPVLVKAEKLYPHELEGLRARFQLARKDLQLQSYRRRLEAVKVRGDKHLPEIEGEEQERLTIELKKLDEVFEFILTCNRPTVLAQGGFERLHELGQLRFDDANGQAQPLLLPREIQSLSITRGTLSPEERREIESHVEHTYRFLTQIPWTRTLRRVPEIAYAHHEKMDGTGYPRAEKAIPIQSRMMSISDIYDALTASDRPYKKAVPHTLALDILKREADSGQLDKELFTVFVEAEIPRRALHEKKQG
ncbi:GAF and HD-GYP domain-containing protein [Pyxidicoccus caerfyrddinensis]|uniref:GAF and HD-GYP domain-containing protein n=1 Tax=Pyxidicoccus caerfyrddinensis TaxID=2709663 RepID=UPI0013D980B0|nr:HD domain-containing phosphohydrolase [Pyxidicoccus caerfyrddinensis]